MERANSISLTLTYADSLVAQNIESAFKDFFDTYKQKTGTTVNIIDLSFNDYRTWLTTQQAAGTMPEVYSVMLSWAWDDYAKGQNVDLTNYLDQESPYNPGQPWKDTFDPSLFAQTQDPSSKKYVTVMQQLVAVRILYNKDIFNKAGITTEPQTWKDFIDDCQKIKAAGSIPFAFAMQNGAQYASWFLTTIFGQLDQSLRDKMDVDGNGIVSKNELAKATDEGLIDYSKDPFKTGFELFKDFSQYWNTDYNAVDAASAQQLWLTGSAAMYAANSSDVLALDQMQGRDFDYGSFPLPTITTDTSPLASGKVTMLGGMANESWAISSTTKGAALNSAVDLLRYLTSQDFVNNVSNKLLWMPVIKGAQVPDKMQGFIKRDYEDIRRANYTGPATLSDFSSYLTMSLQLYLTGNTSFDKFASDLNTEWNKDMTTDMQSAGWNKDNNYGITPAN